MLKTITASFFAIAIIALPSSAETSSVSAEAPVWTPYDGAEISFDVLRKGKPFGKHIVRFQVDDEDNFSVRTDVDLKVKIGPFTAFRYELDSDETWQNGRLVRLTGKTNDDGDKAFVDADIEDNQLSIDGSAFKGSVPLGIIPSSHWNIMQVRSEQMLSTESGEILNMQIKSKGPETLTIGGQAIETQRYLLDSDIDIDLWYDNTGRWVKLTFDARGQTIEYRLSKLY